MNRQEIKALAFFIQIPFFILCGFIEFVFLVLKLLLIIFVKVRGSDSDAAVVSRGKVLGFFVFLVTVIFASAIISRNDFFSFWEGFFVISVFCIFTLISYQIYSYLYFSSDKFNSIKNSIKEYIENCNQLNDHLNDLDLNNLNMVSYDYGNGFLNDQSNFKFKRKEWSKIDDGVRVHNCSSAVLKNARNQPFKYLCKYFNVKVNDETLSTVEFSLNNVLAACQGRDLLESERERILTEVARPFPWLILGFSKERLIRKLGFYPVDLSEIYFPEYTFRYVSPGGNSSYDFRVILDVENLEKFIVYLGDIIDFKKTVKGQRTLMTQELRERIKSRDNFTCLHCGVSVMDEKNLLLEIDHIIPLSKGGVTTEGNLQTLCWKCNRSKGAKIL